MHKLIDPFHDNSESTMNDHADSLALPYVFSEWIFFLTHFDLLSLERGRLECP